MVGDSCWLARCSLTSSDWTAEERKVVKGENGNEGREGSSVGSRMTELKRFQQHELSVPFFLS